MSDIKTYMKELVHPQKSEIEYLRKSIHSALPGAEENVKWNAPNFTINGIDCITLKINPPGKLYIVFHCGVKPNKQLNKENFAEHTAILTWKDEFRAVMVFTGMDEIERSKKEIQTICKKWAAFFA